MRKGIILSSHFIDNIKNKYDHKVLELSENGSMYF